MKALFIAAALALTFTGTASANDRGCIMLADLAEEIAKIRDSGQPQMDVVRDTIEDDIPLEIMRVTIRLTDEVYNSPKMVRKTPEQVFYLIKTECQRGGRK